jgi:uncharacterized membrane protein
MNKQLQRYWEIDFLRGIAVIMMIVYHVLFDLDFLQIVNFPLQTLWFRLFLYPIGTLFLLLVGVSLVLSYNRYYQKHKIVPPFTKYLKRGVILFSLALLITAITWVYPHEGFIVFGVIHCIGLSIILSYFFISKPEISLMTGVVIIILGIYFMNISVSNPYVFWLGLKTPFFYTLDYFPLLPWFGVVLIGIFIGQRISPFLEKRYRVDQKIPRFFKAITVLGKNSLIVYILHQPILYAILFFLFV